MAGKSSSASSHKRPVDMTEDELMSAFYVSRFRCQRRNDGVAAASSDGGGLLVVGGPRQF